MEFKAFYNKYNLKIIFSVYFLSNLKFIILNVKLSVQNSSFYRLFNDFSSMFVQILIRKVSNSKLFLPNFEITGFSRLNDHPVHCKLKLPLFF